jgi:predicted porin
MKKLVMAAAVLGAFAGAAQAQTSVTLYGIGDGNLRFDHTNLGTLKTVGSGGESGSRWGLRGTEDLGGGLKANFIFEQGFDLSDNSVAQGNIGGGASGGYGGSSTQNHGSTGSRLFSRIATVGLSGNFGEIRFGRGYNPLFLNQATADPFGAGFVAEVSNLYNNNTIRNENAVFYDTPRIGGVQVSGVYQLGESTTSAVPASAQAPGTATQAKHGNDRFGLGANYSAGPIYAGVGYEQIRSNLDTYRVRTFDGAATYDFGFLKLHALYWKTRDGNPVASSIASCTPGAVGFVTVAPSYGLGGGCGTALKQSVYSGGITVPFGAWTFMGLYSHLTDKSTYNNNLAYGNPKVNSFGAGLRYSLSKRTIIYAGFDRWNLKTGAQGQAFAGYGTAFSGIQDASNGGAYTAANTLSTLGQPNVNPYSYQVGIRHSF